MVKQHMTKNEWSKSRFASDFERLRVLLTTSSKPPCANASPAAKRTLLFEHAVMIVLFAFAILLRSLA